MRNKFLYDGDDDDDDGDAVAAVEGLVNPPLIDTASEELVLTASDNITITCFGDLPLNWTYPENRVTVCVCSAVVVNNTA